MRWTPWSTASNNEARDRPRFQLPHSDLFFDAFETFRASGDAPLSFADATIVPVARRRSPGFVATFESDFRNLEGVTVVA